jgi:putative oxidoreductase
MQGIGTVYPAPGAPWWRLMMAIILIVTGYQKLAGGIGATASFFAKIGLPAPEVMAPRVIALALLGGSVLLLGFRARWLGILYLVELLVTAFSVKLPNAGWDASRIALMLLAGSVMLILAGAGTFSLDGWLARRDAEPRREPLRTRGVSRL